MLKAKIYRFSVEREKHNKYGDGAKLHIRFMGKVGEKERWIFISALSGEKTPHRVGSETPYWSGSDDKPVLNMWFPTAVDAVLAVQRVLYLWDPFII